MKITHVASGDLWAGAEKQLYVLLNTLRKLPDIEVDAVVLNPGMLSQRLQRDGVPVLQLHEGSMGTSDLYAAIKTHLQDWRPDIVHTHRVKENVLAGIAAHRCEIPSVRTQHGATEHSASMLDFRNLAIGMADKFVGRRWQSRIVAVSEPLRVQLTESFKQDKLTVIENGIEPDAGARAQLTLRDERRRSGEWRIGIAGRLVPLKRVDLFIDAASRVALARPNKRFRFSVIGDGPERGRLEQLAKSGSSPSQIEFTGHLDDAEAAIRHLDALVICSDHEGLPMVALEAMRSGTVVVSHAIGGIPALLEHGASGILAREHTSEAFADALLSLVDGPDLAHQLSDAGLTRIATTYSAARMADQYVQVYHESVSRSQT